MKSRDFAYWLQGFLEINNPESITKEQTQIIKNHLNLVFKHEIDPSIDKDHTPEEIDELNKIHNTTNVLNVIPEGKYGPCPGVGYKLGIHGWYKEGDKLLRC